MNKKFNTVLFILGATVVNMILMILLFLIAFILYASFIARYLPPEVNAILLLGLFVVSIVGTYFLYHRIMRYLSSKVEWEKYFAPLFHRGKK
ncbi:MAG: hypothetical protein SNJ78_00230 [Spirochaetales bacterium]